MKNKTIDEEAEFNKWKESIGPLFGLSIQSIYPIEARDMILQMCKTSFLGGINVGLHFMNELLDDHLSKTDSSAAATPNNPSK